MISLPNAHSAAGSDLVMVRMMYAKRLISTAMLVLMLTPIGALAQDQVASSAGGTQGSLVKLLREQIGASALVELEWAIGTAQGRSQKFELLVEPELEIELPFGLDFTAIGRMRIDALDKLEPGEPSQNEISELSRRIFVGDRVDVELRELYVEATMGRTYLTVGKQQIVWGKADGLKILDVVNPQRFREFILDEIDDARIPLWAVNAEIPMGDFTAQLLFIPDQTYHELPELNSIYAFTSPLFRPTLQPGVTLDFRPVERPNRVLADSDIGVRLSTFWKGWDLTLNYFYHYHDLPVLYRQVSISPGGPRVTVTPKYERSHLVGGTFSNVFSNFTVRGEGGVSSDRFFSTDDSQDADGVIKANELAYLLGLDWFGVQETFLSFQVFQSWITDFKRAGLRDKLDTNASLLLRRDFLSGSVVAEMFWLHNLNHRDGLLRPKISYELSDDVKVWLGLDFFYGNRNGLFGQFDINDRLVIGIQFST